MATYTRPITATFIASGLAGTLGYTVKSAAGTTLIARTTAGVSEDGNSGVYSANVANWDASWSGSIRWDDGNGNVAVETFLDRPSDLSGSTVVGGVSFATFARHVLAGIVGNMPAAGPGALAVRDPLNPSATLWTATATTGDGRAVTGLNLGG